MLTPVVRQGPAPDENRNGGIQSAHQSRSTDVQRVRLLPCTTSLFLVTNAQRSGGRKTTPHPLQADIRAMFRGPRVRAGRSDRRFFDRAPGHELVDARLRPSVDEPSQQLGEIALRIDAVELAGLD